MPKTKGQGLVFGILMSVTMAYGMEVYNMVLKASSAVASHVGRHGAEELSHGVAVEPVCSRSGKPWLAATDFCEKDL